MIATKLIFFALVIAVSGQRPSLNAGHRGSWKCKPTPHGVRYASSMFRSCYRDLLSRPSNLPTLTDSQEKRDIEQCIARKAGIINEDGSFNPVRVHEQVNDIDTDDSVKELIGAGFDQCIASGGEVQVFLDCISNVLVENCAGPSHDNLQRENATVIEEPTLPEPEVVS